MAWFRVDDDLWRHPKVRDCPKAALGAWVVLGSFAASLPDGDGHVPGRWVATLATSTQVQHLVTAGLVHRTDDGGVRFHDWEQWTGRQAAMTGRERQARYRERKRNDARHESRHEGDVTPRPTPTPTPTPDDDRRLEPKLGSAPAESSSSNLDRMLDLAARAIGEERGNTTVPFVAGVRRNLAAERSEEATQLLAEHPDPVTAAGALVGSQVLARAAERALGSTGGPRCS